MIIIHSVVSSLLDKESSPKGNDWIQFNEEYAASLRSLFWPLCRADPFISLFYSHEIAKKEQSERYFCYEDDLESALKSQQPGQSVFLLCEPIRCIVALIKYPVLPVFNL